MTCVISVLTCLVIFVQFYGILGENNRIGNEIHKIYRFKRNHAMTVSDHILNSTNKHDKTDIKKSKISNATREKTFPKRKPNVVKDKSKQADSKITNIRKFEKITTPRNSLHFIEDIDDETPIHHIQVKEPRLKEDPVKAASKNETSKVTKPTKKDKIKKEIELPEKPAKLVPNELIPRLRTADPGNGKKVTIKVSSDLKGLCTNKSANTTKEKDESIAIFRKSTKYELDDQKHEPENSIIEIKERKYEEEIVRFFPTKFSQPNGKKRWDASQNFNPQFSNSPYVQVMNPYQGRTQVDPYQKDSYNKDKHYSAYTCTNYMDPNNSEHFFYANFDDPYKQVEDNRRFQGYGSYNRMRKTWLDRNTKIRTPGRPDEYAESNTKDYFVST